MVAEEVALEKILAATKPLPLEKVSLLEGLGRFSAGTLFSSRPHPPFACSVVDGYALRSKDGLNLRQVTGEQAAGLDRGLTVGKGEAIRIFTGAPIPNGADAVVMQEDVTRQDLTISFPDNLLPGENIRPAGADLAAGQLILREGQRLTPQMVGLLASQGLAQVEVHRQPVITVLSNGDELKSAGEVLQSGELYESNSWMLAALLREMGLSASIQMVPDRPDELRKAIENALATSDVLILSGGVSVGDRDFVRPVLADLGIQPALWRVRMKPGKPLLFATASERLIFGLPGNPVAVFVTFLTMVRPALLQMSGAEGDERFLRCNRVTLAEKLENPGDRPHYIRGRIREGKFTRHGLQESHALFGLASCDAVLRLDAGKVCEAGEMVQARTW